MRGIVGGVKRAVLLAGLALAAAACAAGQPEPGPLGVVEVGPGGFIEIRSLSNLGGENPGASYRAAALAIDHYGPIKGRAVALVGMHDLCEPGGGRANSQTIAADARVVGVIGTRCSVTAVEALPVISAAGMVMISPTNTSPALTSDLRGAPGSSHHPGYYRTAHNDLITGRVVAEFAFHELSLRRMAAIHDGDPYTMGLATAFAEEFRGLGGEVVGMSVVSKDAADAAGAVAAIAAGDPEGIFFPLFVEAGAAVAREIAATAGLAGATLISADAVLRTEFLQRPESEGIYIAAPSLDFSGNTNAATAHSADHLLTVYRQEYGEAPETSYWAHAYDAATLLLTAIEQVAVEVGGRLYIDRAALRRALSETSGFGGLTGALSCDAFGDCGGGGVQIVHHKDTGMTDIARLPVVYRGQR